MLILMYLHISVVHAFLSIILMLIVLDIFLKNALFGQVGYRINRMIWL